MLVGEEKSYMCVMSSPRPHLAPCIHGHMDTYEKVFPLLRLGRPSPCALPALGILGPLDL